MPFSSKGFTHRSTATGTRGMVTSAHPLASLAGVRILLEGGNAIDAAVATAAALNVVEPYMSGLGGDGYMHVFSARENEHRIVDYMGRSPAATDLSLYDSVEKRDRGPLCSLVPGACGGWLAALERYGSMDAKTVFGPAIGYAEDGFAVTVKNAEFIGSGVSDLVKYSPSAEHYLHQGRGPRPGEVITQTDLGRTYRAIAEGGSEVFYSGEIGERIVKHLEGVGGLITRDDLSAFKVEMQEPVCSSYRGYRVFTPRPPCQGIQFLEMLNILEGFDLEALGHNRVETLHLFIEAAKLATADRVKYTIDDDATVAAMISKEYAAAQRERIGDKAALGGGEAFTKDQDALEPGDPTGWMKSECTTHFNAVDAEGNAVSVTQSLGSGFGSAVVVPGTGIALNNLMRWFDYDPESSNVIGPRKKMELCMAPSQVWDDGGPRLLVGTPGSYGILQTTPQMMMNVLDHGMNIQAAIEAPRLKAFEGYQVDVETRISEGVLRELEKKGHTLNRLGDWSAGVGGGQGIEVDREEGSFMGGADPRRDGIAIGV
jgi:gamma-glutamyltranspeptidase/glutathione hydrolase